MNLRSFRILLLGQHSTANPSKYWVPEISHVISCEKLCDLIEERSIFSHFPRKENSALNRHATQDACFQQELNKAHRKDQQRRYIHSRLISPFPEAPIPPELWYKARCCRTNGSGEFFLLGSDLP